MRRFPTAAVLTALCLGLTSHAALAAWVPPEIESRLSWLSQQDLTNQGPAVLDTLPQSARIAIDGLLRSAAQVTKEAPQSCDVTMKAGNGSAVAVDPLERLRQVNYALLGRVRASEQGLAHGMPATLHELQVEQVMKWPSEDPSPRTVFVLDYSGEIRIGEIVICSEASRGPGVPEVGLGVAILADEIVQDSPVLVNVSSDALFFETSEGGAFVPGGVDAASTWVELVDALTSGLQAHRNGNVRFHVYRIVDVFFQLGKAPVD